jgi:hypothetical protein
MWTAMDETMWRVTYDPSGMLAYLQSVTTEPSERQLRLLLCGFCRCCWRDLDDVARAAIDLAERYTEGSASKQDLQAAHEKFATAGSAWRHLFNWPASAAAWPVQLKFVCSHATNSNRLLNAENVLEPWTRPGQRPVSEYWPTISNLVREIVGNPFRPVAVDPPWLRWQDGLVARLAQSLYDDRHFAELPILADALEDAGCDSPDLLTHLRSPGPHVLGCWALDALIGKG